MVIGMKMVVVMAMWTQITKIVNGDRDEDGSGDGNVDSNHKKNKHLDIGGPVQRQGVYLLHLLGSLSSQKVHQVEAGMAQSGWQGSANNSEN